MVDVAQLEKVLASVTAWADSQADILGIALVGSWARGTARPDSDVDLIVLASDPDKFRRDSNWLAEMRWAEGNIVGWHDVDFGMAWSRHVALAPICQIEFTFCGTSWVETDPVDSGTVKVMSDGCRVLVDKVGLFEKFVAVAMP